MKNTWKWILFGFAVFLLAFCIALPLFGGFPAAAMPRLIGSRMIHRGMIGGGLLGGAGSLFRLAFPLLGIGGLAALVYALLKRPAPSPAPAAPAAPVEPCAYCAKPLDPGWVACPFCGKKRR
ncbi:MAG: hypothetical protein JW929_06585 [Anaerolineales bacterium]|nr:hypothetical protein [Anaerolineales bacterium]